MMHIRCYLPSRIESRFYIVESPCHEFIITVFYEEGTGLVAVIAQELEARPLYHLCDSLEPGSPQLLRNGIISFSVLMV